MPSKLTANCLFGTDDRLFIGADQGLYRCHLLDQLWFRVRFLRDDLDNARITAIHLDGAIAFAGAYHQDEASCFTRILRLDDMCASLRDLSPPFPGNYQPFRIRQLLPISCDEVLVNTTRGIITAGRTRLQWVCYGWPSPHRDALIWMDRGAVRIHCDANCGWHEHRRLGTDSFDQLKNTLSELSWGTLYSVDENYQLWILKDIGQNVSLQNPSTGKRLILPPIDEIGRFLVSSDRSGTHSAVSCELWTPNTHVSR